MNKSKIITLLSVIFLFIVLVCNKAEFKIIYNIITNEKYKNGINLEVINNTYYEIQNIVLYASERERTVIVIETGNIKKESNLAKTVNYISKDDSFALNYQVYSINGSKVYPALFVDKDYKSCIIRIEINDIDKNGEIKGKYYYHEGIYTSQGKLEKQKTIK